jgi:dihydrofolate synthase/folylpolyglutamate synthase
MTAKNTYDTCLDTMFNLRRFGIKLGLDLIEGLLDGMGNPQTGYRSIHIAGTNGKGSIASTLAAILQASGLTVGLYTSPHLVRFNERIRINGREVTDREVIEAFETVSAVAAGEREATFFEVTTAMGLYLFARRGVDWAIIETGMGGRLDATNIISPRLSVISNISLEHREFLGNTIAAIAAEKGGIIKPSVPVVTGVRQPSAIGTLARIAAERTSPLFRLGDDFSVRRTSVGTFTYTGFGRQRRGLTTSLAGRHQVDNAALALAACDLLRMEGVGIDETAIRKGLTGVTWPGRLEIVKRQPLTILDGAHNLAAVQRLADYLKTSLKDRRLTLVVGILDDKPFRKMLAALMPLCHRVIFTRPVINRSLDPEILFRESGMPSARSAIVPDVPAAVARAMDTTSIDDAVCIAGSLYVVGEARRFLKRDSADAGAS